MNSHVTFKLAKLLKEKGFEQMTQTMYHISGEDFYNINEGIVTDINYFPRPIIADVVMWLYDTYGIWISIDYRPNHKDWSYNYSNINWSIEEFDKQLKKDIDMILEEIFDYKIKFNSPKEAYEAAIEYCLTELIK